MSARDAQTEVLVVGEYFCDLIFSGLAEVPRPGAEFFARSLTVTPGGCYNMALALTRLGIRTAWAADFGTDLFSQTVLEAAGRDGLDAAGFTRLDHHVQRVSAAFTHQGERGFISFSETEVVPPEVALLDRLRPKWLLQSFRYGPDWLAFIAAARARGARVFADCRNGEFSLATPGVAEFLALCDVFSPNEAEALALTGAGDVETAAARLCALVPTLVVKRGERGALAFDHGRRLEVAAPAVEVVDTVGAGDAFNAGYLSGVLWDSGFAECVRLAVAGGSLSTTGAGSSAAPDARQLAAAAAALDGGAPATCPAALAS
jgi:sugar/nucleoside kinase (ribokinase family)